MIIMPKKLQDLIGVMNHKVIRSSISSDIKNACIMNDDLDVPIAG